MTEPADLDAPASSAGMAPRRGTVNGVDRELRDWLRSLAGTGDRAGPRADPAVFSTAGADYLERIATDGTLKAALDEIATAEPDLAG